mmetsp:Transcript_22590/g.59679  ORF Transcript_22590/g.59679 Transcript_22590/m.59679 type:complete len:202 (-) Transcript_22590:163-768(-)
MVILWLRAHLWVHGHHDSAGRGRRPGHALEALRRLLHRALHARAAGPGLRKGLPLLHGAGEELERLRQPRGVDLRLQHGREHQGRAAAADGRPWAWRRKQRCHEQDEGFADAATSPPAAPLQSLQGHREGQPGRRESPQHGREWPLGSRCGHGRGGHGHDPVRRLRPRREGLASDPPAPFDAEDRLRAGCPTDGVRGRQSC